MLKAQEFPYTSAATMTARTVRRPGQLQNTHIPPRAALITSRTVRRPGQLQNTNIPPMYCTELIREEHFTAGRQLIIMLLLAESDSTVQISQ